MTIKLQYVGADPELFLKSKLTGQMVSAHGLIPGDKKNPHPVKNGAVQVDGMAAEFNINPASTKKKFVDNLKSVMRQLADMLPEYDLVIEPSVDFSKEVWEKVPEEATILGCEPDYNAYTSKENVPPNPKVTFRTAAGHVHLGWTQDVDPKDPGHMMACEILARELDYHLALPAALLDIGEASTRRRQLYGSPGAYRPKSYGMEYRVLSNFWLSNPEYMIWVYDVCHKVFQNLIENRKVTHQTCSKLVQEVLTTGREFTVGELIQLQQSVLLMPPKWEEVYFAGKENPLNSAIYLFDGTKVTTNPTIYF